MKFARLNVPKVRPRSWPLERQLLRIVLIKARIRIIIFASQIVNTWLILKRNSSACVRLIFFFHLQFFTYVIFLIGKKCVYYFFIKIFMFIFKYEKGVRLQCNCGTVLQLHQPLDPLKWVESTWKSRNPTIGCNYNTILQLHHSFIHEKDTQCENFNFIDLKIINKIKSKTLSLDR